MTGGRAISPIRPWLWLGVLVTVALALRCANFAEVFRPEAVVFPGNDPYYHMRRVLRILQTYPHVPLFDAFINHPYGAVAIWAPLFDLFAATVMRVAGLGGHDVRAAESVAAWIAPVLGALTVVPVYHLGRRLAGALVGLAAGLLLAIQPAHIWYSRLGFFDHHSAVTLVQVVLVLALTGACLPREDGRPRTFAALATVACIVAGLLTWSGFLFFVAVVDGFLLLRLAAVPDDRHAPRLLWITHLPAAALLWPCAAAFVSETGAPFTAITLSYFHVGALVGGGLFGVALDLYRSPRARGLWRPLRLALPATLLVALSILLVRTSALAEGLGWLLARDVFMAQVNESRPLLDLSRQGAELHARLHGLVTVLFPVSVLAWVWLVGRRWRPWGADRAPRQLFLVWSAALLVAATGQRRFLESFAPAEALLVALAAVAAARTVWRSTRVGAILGTLLLLAAAVGPWWRGELFSAERLAEKRGELWLYHAIGSFEPSPSDPRLSGVLAPWYLGHRILYQTGLPVVTDNFGRHIGADSYRDWGAFFLAESENEAVARLERRRARYVFVDDDLDFVEAALYALGLPLDDYFIVDRRADESTFTPLERYLKTMAFRMARLRGNGKSFLAPEGGILTVPPLEHFRLVHEVPRHGPKASLKVYERVAGARLEISGAPGSRVHLKYRSPSDPPLEYAREVVLDERGRGQAVVPLSGIYAVSSGGPVRELEVSEEAVLRGASVRLPRPE